MNNILLILAAFIGCFIVAEFEDQQCQDRWFNSDLTATYSFFTGCSVQLDDGTIVHESVVPRGDDAE